MSHRTAAASLVGLLFCGFPVHAQTPPSPQMPGAAAPGPTAPRPQMPAVPPRDGNLSAVPTGTGGIRGRVVAADTGTPIRRAQVRVTGALPGLQQVVSTDPDGRYEFKKLPASRYTIVVARGGYVTLQFGQQRPFEPGKPLTLADGEVAEKIDFALPRGGVIAGRVVDDVGEPIAGVRLQAQRYVYQPGGGRRLVTAGTPAPSVPTTDDLGQFRVYGLMPGSYVLSAAPQNIGAMGITLPDGPLTSISAGSDANSADGYATTYFPGTANAEEAQPIMVSLGQEAAASFALVSARMSRISGVIRNSQGNPAGRVMVLLRTQDGSGTSMMAGMAQADGSFALANVPPGEHMIDVRSLPAGLGTAMIGGPAQGEDEFATVTVSVTGQDLNGLVITTGPGATISGRLLFDGASGRPQAPAQPFRVMAAGANPAVPSMGIGGLDNGVVDEAGNFRLRGVSGPVLFQPAVQGWNLKSVTLNGVDITDTTFDAKPSTNVTGLEVTVTDRQTTLSGVVKNARGDTIKDFVVVVFPVAAKEGMMATRFTRTIRPDQVGRYQVKGLPAGDYVAVAVESLEQGGEWDPAFQQLMKPRGKTLRLTDGQSATLDLSLVQ